VRRHKAKAIDTSTTASANSIQYWPDTPKSVNCPTSQASIAAKLHAQADAQLTRGFFADSPAGFLESWSAIERKRPPTEAAFETSSTGGYLGQCPDSQIQNMTPLAPLPADFRGPSPTWVKVVPCSLIAKPRSLRNNCAISLRPEPKMPRPAGYSGGFSTCRGSQLRRP
jgi:hypothetical protein